MLSLASFGTLALRGYHCVDLQLSPPVQHQLVRVFLFWGASLGLRIRCARLLRPWDLARSAPRDLRSAALRFAAQKDASALRSANLRSTSLRSCCNLGPTVLRSAGSTICCTLLGCTRRTASSSIGFSPQPRDRGFTLLDHG